MSVKVTRSQHGSLNLVSLIRFSYSYEVPVILKILKSCSTSDSPSKRALSLANSAKMHPTAQMSTSCHVISFQNNISGAQYHSLRASLPDLSLSLGSSGVYMASFTRAIHERVKSAILMFPWLSDKMLSSFKFQCIRPF